MKKYIVIAVIIILAAGIVLAQPLRPLKWQDFLPKPTHQWLSKFGYDDGSHLAFHIVLLQERNVALEKRLEVIEAALKAREPNETEAPVMEEN